MVVGARQVRLDVRPVTAVRASSGSVLLWTRGGVVLRVHERSLRVDRLTARASGPPVVDPRGNFVAWQDAGPGRAAVLLYFLGRPDTTLLDRQLFPATPSCCDNPFQVDGMAGSDLHASLPSVGRTWVWNVYEGQDGIPNDLPDSLADVTRLRGLGSGHIAAVEGEEIVVEYPPRSKDSETQFGFGDTRGGRYREVRRLSAVEVDLEDPRGRRIVYWTAEGVGRVIWRGERVRAEVELVLPTTLEVDALTWEDDQHVLVDGVDPALRQRALIRCDARSGECEVADLISRGVLVAHR